MQSDKPLRICLVASYDLIEEGGVKKHTIHLAEQLRRMGDEVEVIGPYSGTAPLPAGITGFPGVINIPSNGSDNHLGIFVRPWAVRSFLREGRFDVVHLQEPGAPSLPWWATWFAGGAARLATFHAFSETERLAVRLSHRLLRRQVELCDRAIAVSPAAARTARAFWSRPMALIPNGVDTTVFTPPTRPRAPGPARLLFVGHWRDPRKGLPVLLAAFSRLRSRGHEVTLDVVGGGGQTQAVRVEGVRYHGPVSCEARLSELYRGCDLFVAPSMGMESFGIVLLEAMACARALVCSDIEGYRHVAPKEGSRLVSPGDAEALADAIAPLLLDETARQRMGDINRLAAANFDWNVIAKRVRREYVTAVDQRERQRRLGRQHQAARRSESSLGARQEGRGRRTGATLLTTQ